MKIEIDGLEDTKADYRAGVLLYSKREVKKAFTSTLWWAIFCVSQVVLGWQLDSLVLLLLGGGAGALALISAFLRFIFYPIWLPNLLYRTSRQHGPIKMVIDDTGIRQKAATGETSLTWEAVEDLKEDGSGSVLCLRGKGWIYLPHRSLTLEQRQELRDRIALHRSGDRRKVTEDDADSSRGPG
jgi:hypothetical protein